VTTMEDKFWIWSPYSTVQGMAFVTELSGLSDGQLRKLYRGEEVTPTPDILIENFEPGHFYDQLGAYIGILLVSPVLQAVLQAHNGARLQFIPAHIRDQVNLSYFVVNVLDTVPALDLDRSQYETFDESDIIRKINQFILRSIPNDAPSIFHVAEDRSLILVRDELYHQLTNVSKYPGILTPVEEYQNEF
jgi:hypothetical protein